MKRSTKIRFCCRGASVLFYPAALPLSRQTLTGTAGVSRRHRAQLGSCWPFYSGKHHKHGMNLQVIASPDGEILWVSGLAKAIHALQTRETEG